ncbi:MAG: TIGR03560 family F420-dependent LLM class oxidoreductase [Thermomicrobiales bacterium]
MVKLGIMIEGQEGLNWERWHRLIDDAERLGFDSLWRSDHLFSVMGESQRETLALWPSLTAVALKSSRIEFGQLVSPTTFRHPVHLAADGASVDQASGGRFWLGVGAGWNESEHASFGFRLPPLKERMDRFAEALAVIKLLGTGEPATFAGEHFQLDGARTTFTPTRASGARLMIGGSGEKRTLRLVAEYADEWNATLMAHDTYVQKTEVLERHCEAVGRDPGEIQRSMMIGHIVGRDEGELRRRASELQAIIPGTRDVEVDALLSRQRERGWLVGTPPEVVEQIQARGAQGVERIMMQTFLMDDVEQLELIASEVIPHV